MINNTKSRIRNSLLVLLLTVCYICLKMKTKEIWGYRKKIKKIQKLYMIANKWLSLEVCGKQLDGVIAQNGYKTIALYGMGDLGQRLSEKFNVSEKVDVLYAIDQNAENLSMILPVYSFEEALQLEKPDLIIVTIYCSDGSLVDLLRKNFSCQVWTIEDLLNEA